MRKLLLSLVFVLCVVSSYAQLKVSSSSSLPISVGAGVWFNPNPNKMEYYLIFATSNMYDDPFGIVLGKTKEQALKTLDDLINLCNQPIGTSTNFDSGFGYTITLDIFDVMGKKPTMSAKGYEGIVFIKAKQLEKCKKKIIAYKE